MNPAYLNLVAVLVSPTCPPRLTAVLRPTAAMLLAAAPEQGVAHLLDEQGQVVRSFKDCRPGPRGLCTARAAVVSAEASRSFTHVWAGGKEQPQYRCQAPERLGPILATSDAAHVVGGAVSGKLYLWQLSTGRLLLAWNGHFRGVTALATVAADGYLVTAGEDAILHVWSFASLLSAAVRLTPPHLPRSCLPE